MTLNILLSIFNNGSHLWILFIVLLAWVAIWGYRTYVSHKSGYQAFNSKTGKYEQKPADFKALLSNGNFIFLVAGIVGIILFILLINADYI